VAQTLSTSLIGTGLALVTFTTFRNAAIVALFAGLGTLAVSPITLPLANRGRGGAIETFAVNTAIRCVFTFAETLAGLVTAAKGFNYITFHWPSALSQATVAALLSILTSVASSGSGEPNSPSLVKGVK
jgi:Putative lactococcus lactis phage r1t holin